MEPTVKVESLVDYTVHYVKENGKTSQRRFRLESALGQFLGLTPSAYRMDKTEVTITWLQQQDDNDTATPIPTTTQSFLPT